MYQAKQLTVSTRGRGLVDITDEVQRAVKGTGIRDGLCTLFLHHTSASLL
ncbi:MAG: YjbQ family protein, partial [Myxococcaceae bacterium]